MPVVEFGLVEIYTWVARLFYSARLRVFCNSAAMSSHLVSLRSMGSELLTSTWNSLSEPLFADMITVTRAGKGSLALSLSLAKIITPLEYS
ncbi:MAG: hypothetical protein VKK63_06595 [Synechococcus sp.]|nr:hypothetical protein [Synechococcus sp.]